MSLGLFLWDFPVNFAGKDGGGGEEWGAGGKVRECKREVLVFV